MKKSLINILLSKFFTSNALEQCVFLAIHLYAMKRAVDTNRNKGVRAPSASVPSLLWQGHKIAMTYSSKVREMFRDHWNSSS